MSCWFFGFIHPTKWASKKKLRNQFSYIKEAPEITEPTPLPEEQTDKSEFVCPYCGVLLNQRTKFCTKCGHEIK